MPEAPASRLEEIALLRACIQRSGLSIREYAQTVLIRAPRTLERWLAGQRQIPKAVLDLITRQAGDGHPLPTGSDETSSPASPASRGAE